MATLTLTALDYVETWPRRDTELTVTLVVVAEWHRVEPIVEPDDDPTRPGRPGPDGRSPNAATRPGRMRRGGNQVITEREEEQLSPIAKLTDPLGRAVFEWPNTPGSPLAEAFARARRPRRGNPRVSAFAEFRVATPIGRRIDTSTLPQQAREDEAVTADVYFDLAESIVGHTTETSARLWFRTHLEGLPRGSRYVCEVREAGAHDPVGSLLPPSTPPIFSTDVQFAIDWADTAVVDASGLTQGTPYSYHLLTVHRGGKRVEIASGSFRTAAQDTANLRIGFASCHQPLSLAANEAWEQLDRENPDLLLLTGDQIYGDGTQKKANETWFDSYARRYQYFWRFRPVRNALRHRPIYMMLDDHDVADDWGTTFTVDGPKQWEIFPGVSLPNPEAPKPQQVDGALKAYQAFQQAHSPLGRSRNPRNTAVDYPFRRGPIAFYMLDGRTQRGRDTAGSPVLGSAQRERFRRWAEREARSADVIVVATAVPFAFADVELAADIIRKLDDPSTGAAVGAGAGAILGGVAGALVGGVFGLFAGPRIAEYIYESYGIQFWNGEVIEPDLADHWADEDNKPDLTYILDILFDLSNDVRNGGARPRAVIVLGGDIHMGAIHRIRSTSPRHARNPVIWQFTSSPISHDPSPKSVVAALEQLQCVSDLAGSGSRSFPLTESRDGEYLGEFASEFLTERNFGILEVTRTDPTNRTYFISGAVRSVSGNAMEYDLTFDLAGGAPPRFERRPMVKKVVVREVGSEPARELSAPRKLFSWRRKSP